MSGNNISDFQLRWLLSLLNNNDVVVALIFGLAYAERSGEIICQLAHIRFGERR